MIYILLGLGAVLIMLYEILAVPMIMLVYLASPIWGRVFSMHYILIPAVPPTCSIPSLGQKGPTRT